MSTETTVSNLKINKLTSAQYATITPSATELYLTDEVISSSDVTTALGYTPENQANKTTTLSASSTDTQYPSAKCVYDAIQAGGGGSITVDQTYSASSTNAQSGVAINGAKFIRNVATGTNALTLGGTASSATSALNIGATSTAGGGYSVAVGYYAASNGGRTTAIGYGARIGGSTPDAIQIGNGTNSTAKSLSVGFYNTGNYQLLDGATGLIPDARLNSKAIDNWGCPDYSSGVSMGLPTSPVSTTSTTYTCPSAGYCIIAAHKSTAGNNFIVDVNGQNVITYVGYTAMGTTTSFPVSKNDIVKAYTNSTSASWQILVQKFYPLKGEA